MSYVLWHGTPLKMSKGTISMWFRVPKESAGKIEWTEEKPFSPLQNMIPLLAFSGQPYGPWTEFTFPVINTFNHATSSVPPFDFQPFPYTGKISGPTWQLPYWPCLIALYITENKTASLVVVLQTKDVGVPQNTNHAVVAAAGVVVEGRLFGPTSLTFENASHVDAKMDWFNPNLGGPEVTYDAWHHVLLSWDLQGSNSAFGNAFDPAAGPPPDTPLHEYFTAKSLMYCALDDENLTKDKLPTSYWVDGFGDNEIVCYSCWHLGGTSYFTVPPDPDLSPPYYGFPTYTVTFTDGIQTDAVAVPSGPKYERWLGDSASPATEEVDAIKKIEVAELQIFAGLTLDTSKLPNRRAFINFIESDTDQENQDNTLMAPVKPEDTETILGRRPDILLHQTRNWKKGKNTGTIGLRRDPNEGDKIIEAGQFRPNGEIKKWIPDPRLLSTEGSGTA